MRKYPKDWRIPWWIYVCAPAAAVEMRGIRKRMLANEAIDVAFLKELIANQDS